MFSMVGISVIVFGLSRMGPDPVYVYVVEGYHLTPESLDALRTKWGLDRPMVIQYFTWVSNVLRGDLGESISRNAPVTSVIKERIGPSVQLGLAGWLIATIVGVPLGVLSALRRGKFSDYVARFVALFGQATPTFWLGIIMIWIFAVHWQVLPASGRPAGSPIWVHVQHMILPALAIGFNPWAIYVRITRSAMLEVLDAEFIKFARAKGVPHTTLVVKHALRNALIQPITVSTVVMASFITGSVFAETVFAWPGLGRLVVRGAMDNDFPLVSAIVLLFGAAYVLLNLIADLAYAYIDPRIRYS